MAKKQPTEQEKKNELDFKELCAYIEKEIFNYENNQKLQKKACLRLRGLAKGQTIANNKHEQYGEYPYEVILLAFKANKVQIVNAIRNKDFESEENKVAYISAIVRDKLNDVYTRFINAQKSQDKIETVSTEAFEYQGAEYKGKTETSKAQNKLDDKFKELW